MRTSGVLQSNHHASAEAADLRAQRAPAANGVGSAPTTRLAAASAPRHGQPRVTSVTPGAHSVHCTVVFCELVIVPVGSGCTATATPLHDVPPGTSRQQTPASPVSAQAGIGFPVTLSTTVQSSLVVPGFFAT